ncbi:MAG: TIGR02217 family protein [Bdellovibrionales bacterium]
MSFDEIRLPLNVAFGSSGGPLFSTEIITVDGGVERRNQNWAHARRRFDAATGLRTAADGAVLTAFFYARAGRARGFRLKDWGDYTSSASGVAVTAATDQTIGTGDGTQTVFQLKKNYTSGSITHVRTISKPVSDTVLVAVNGVAQGSGWSVDTTTGIITFSTAPANGHAVTAGYEFDVPVRFDTDTLNITQADFANSSARIPLVEVRV